MIIYVKKLEETKLTYSLFNIFKAEKNEDKNIIYLPINKHSRKRKIEKVCEKLSKYFYNNNIKNVVLEEELMENDTAKNVLYSNNINIIDEKILSRFLVYNLVKKIYEFKLKRIEAGEITILVNDADNINIQTIKLIAKDVKRMNIVTNNIRKFRNIVDYLYNELGILIKLSNNMKTNLKNSDVIVNIDFPEELINRLEIPYDATILNIPENINIKSKKFSGINIKSWNIKVPEKYEMQGFNINNMYASYIYGKPIIKIFEQISNDNIKIKDFIGLNGIINPKEFNFQKFT